METIPVGIRTFRENLAEKKAMRERIDDLEHQLTAARDRADALDAHLDRFMDATDEFAMADDDWVEDLERVRNDKPKTSLAQLKARVAAEAFEQGYLEGWKHRAGTIPQDGDYGACGRRLAKQIAEVFYPQPGEIAAGGGE